MPLRVTRQATEFLGTVTSTLRMSRQRVEFLGSVPSSLRISRQNIEYLIPFKHFFINHDLTFTYNILANAIRSRSVEMGALLFQTIIVGGARYSQNVIETLTSDIIIYNQEKGEYETISSGLSQNVDRLLIGNREIKHGILFDSEIEYVYIKSIAIPANVSSTLSINQTVNVSKIKNVIHTLNFTQNITILKTRNIQDTITFEQNIETAKILTASIASTLNLNSIFTYTQNENTNFVLCNYYPFIGQAIIGPQAPSPNPPILYNFNEIILTSDSNSISLRNPELGDRDRLSFQRINRETRGGTLIVYANPEWPRSQQLVLEIRGLSETKSQDLLTFIQNSLGQNIELRDWEGREWGGLITSIQEPIIRNSECNNAITIEFEGGYLYRPSVTTPLLTLDQIIKVCKFGRGIMSDIIFDQDIARNIICNRALSSSISIDFNIILNTILSRLIESNITLDSIIISNMIRPRSISSDITFNHEITVQKILGRVVSSTLYITDQVTQPTTRYWIKSGAAGNWSDAANWAFDSGGSGGAGKPNSFDFVYFNANGLANCNIDTNIDIKNLSLISAYTGTLTNTTYNLDIELDTIIGNTATLLGSGIWTIGGSIDYSGCTTLTYNTATIKLQSTKAGTNYWIAGANVIDQIEINGNITGSNPKVNTLLKVNAILTLPSAYLDTYAYTDIHIYDDGQITGAGTICMSNTREGHGILTQNGAITVSTLRLHRWLSTGILTPGIYAPTILKITQDTVTLRTVKLSSGNYDFNCNIQIDISSTGNQELNNTNNPNINVTGNITVNKTSTGIFVWTQGTGTLTFNGTVNQNINLDALSVEDIVINKASGTLTLMDHVTTDSFDLQYGTINFGNKNITSEGNFTISSNANVVGTSLNGSTITVSGNLSLNGSSGDLLDLVATSTWYLQVTGTATANYVNVAYSNAAGYTTVTATNSTDSGNNTNWNFV